MTDKQLEMRIWQSKLYELQRDAPVPCLVPCPRKIPNRPPQYGLEYHGPISRQETEALLENYPNGAYLIRQSQRGTDAYTLVIWFDKTAKNYKLFYDPEKGHHFVGEKRFETIECLVADGLIHFHIETRGAEVLKKMAESSAYERTPFYKMRYHTFTGSMLTENTSIDDASNKHAVTEGRSKLSSSNSRSTSKPEYPECYPTPAPRKYKIHTSTMNGRNPLSTSDGSSKAEKTYRETAPSRKRHEPSTRFQREFNAFSGDAHDAIPPVPPPRTASNATGSPIGNHDVDSFNTASPNSPVSFTTENVRNTVCNPTFSQPSWTQSITPSNTSEFVNKIHETLQPLSNSSFKEPDPTMACEEEDMTSSVENSRSDSPFTRSSRSLSIASSLWGQSHPTAHSPSSNHPHTPTDQVCTEVNGTSSQAVLELLERYQLPKACLATDRVPSIELNRKKHDFKVHTFRGPHWCDFCTHFMWGLVGQGLKCTDCGFQAHKRCSDRVPDDCLPDIKHMKRVFGVDLTKLTVAERKPIPTILERCVAEVERRGLTVEGLYRIPGSHDRIEQYRAAFDKDSETAPISPSRCPDVNVITSLIKSFLRQLPVPLLTYDAHPKLLEVIRNEDMTKEEQLAEVASILSTLPAAHYESLRFFLRHINRLAEHHEKNMMPAENLAVVLTPSLMNTSYSNPVECLLGMRVEHDLTVLLIKEYARLFPSSDPSPVRRTTTMPPETTSPTSVSPRSNRFTGTRKLWFLRNRHSAGPPMLGNLLHSPTAEKELASPLTSSLESAF